jgi:hypothetical protein
MLPKKIPRVQTLDRNINQIQQNILPVIEEILQNPVVGGIILKSQKLAVGSNTISHNLGRTLQGWVPIRVRSQATISDLQDANTTPNLTLILYTSAAVVVDLLVF